MTLDKAIERYTSNAEYERTHGNLQGCLDFRQLAEWLKDYKRLKELEPCEDVIRREDAINAVSEALEHVFVENEDVARKMMNKLPSVNSQPKTGHWINIDATHSKCDRCEAVFEIVSENGEVNYCPNCGVGMVEPQESEEQK